MRLNLPAFLLAAALLAVPAGAVFADEFEDAQAAFDSGRYREALTMFKPLAKTGEPAAQNNLGVIYANGLGVPVNYAEARKWFLMAAGQGLAEAQNNLGSLFYKGSGEPKNYTEAAKWYGLAAEQGNAESCGRLGEMYAMGRGVEQDLEEAGKWLQLALEGRETALLSDRSSIALGNVSYARLVTGEFAEAQEAAEEALRGDSSQAWIRLNLAHALLMQGHIREAVKVYGRCKADQTESLKEDFELLKALFPERAGGMETVAREIGFSQLP